MVMKTFFSPKVGTLFTDMGLVSLFIVFPNFSIFTLLLLIIEMGSRLRKRQSDLFFEGRDAPPSHYFKIQSFSSLSKASIEKYNSDKFEAGDYKWKLSIYPNGNKDRDGHGHVSISLTLVDTSSLLVGWEVKAIVNFFVFDQVGDMYHTLSAGNIRRFHAMQTEMGVPKFIDLEVFSDSLNGYLVNDTCVFGVDIFILKQTRKGEYLSVVKEIVTDHKWKIRIYPRGNGDGKGNSISMFLCLDETTLSPDTKPFVKVILRVKSQNKSDDFEFKEIKKIDMNEERCVDIDEFGALSKLIMDERDEKEDMRKAFWVLDQNSNGFI
ncbi:unnamed protein product [Camellia sinensis]